MDPDIAEEIVRRALPDLEFVHRPSSFACAAPGVIVVDLGGGCAAVFCGGDVDRLGEMVDLAKRGRP